MTLTTEQHAELNAFCATHVMGMERSQIADCWNAIAYPHSTSWLGDFKPTTSPADAMAVLEKCADILPRKSICICKMADGYEVYNGGSYYIKTVQKAETLPLAIVLFAKALFEKEAAK